MRLAKSILVLGLTALASAACGGSGGSGGGGGGVLGFVDISGLDPSVEAYTGSNSLNLSENGYLLRINASAAPVHHGLVSVWFQDVEFHEVLLPSNSHPEMIPVAPGGTYVFRAWFFGIDVGGGATVTDVPIDLRAIFFLGAVPAGPSPTTTTYLTGFGSWVLLSCSFQVPAGVDRCEISMKATAALALNVDLYLDDFSLERTN